MELNQDFKKINIKFIAPIITLVIVIVIGFSYWFIFQPIVRQMSRGGNLDLAAKEAESKSLQEYLETQNKFLESFHLVKDQEKILRMLPPQKDIPSLFGQLEDIAQKNGFVPVYIQITDTLDFIDNSTAVASMARKPIILEKDINVEMAEGVRQFTLNFKVSGGDYNNLKNLLKSIEDNTRIIDVVSVQYHHKVKSYDIILNTYYSEEEKI